LPYGRARARTVSYCHYYGDATIMDACVYGSMPLLWMPVSMALCH